MRSEPDFSGINPLRVKTARHRLKVIEEYLALPKRSRAEKLAAATALNLSTSAFQRLINNWQKYKSVSKLVVDGTAPVRNKKFHPDVRKMIMDEIDEAGHNASVSKIHRNVTQGCQAIGQKAPSLPAVYDILLEAQSQKPELVGGEPRIVIGRIWFKLPIFDQISNKTTTQLANLLIAVALPERIITSHVVTIGDVEPCFKNLLDDLRATEIIDAPFRPLVMKLADLRANRAIVNGHGFELLVPPELSTQTEIKRAFGTQFARLTPFYRRKLLKPDVENLLCRQDQPLTEDEALAVVETAITDSNVKWGKLSDKLEFKLRR
ncbi:hypothetical protein QUA99_25235 [Microcoleus sp. F10-B2]